MGVGVALWLLWMWMWMDVMSCCDEKHMMGYDLIWAGVRGTTHALRDETYFCFESSPHHHQFFTFSLFCLHNHSIPPACPPAPTLTRPHR